MTRRIARTGLIALGCMTWLVACNRDDSMDPGDRASTGEADARSATTAPTARAEPLQERVDESGLVVRVLEPGSGATAEPGMLVSVHYTGWLHAPDQPDERGSKFDSSLDRGQPFQFPLGAGRVIQGWDRGVAGMQIGERRELVIPPELGYGARGAGNVIPPNATLVFEVELLSLD